MEEIPQVVISLIQARISDLNDRDFTNPLNGEIDQELIEDTIQEILELEDFLSKID
jgi:adenosine deaminase